MTPPNAPTAAERAGAASPLTADERAAWTIRKAPPTYGEAALLLLRYEATLTVADAALLAARRENETLRELVRAALPENMPSYGEWADRAREVLGGAP